MLMPKFAIIATNEFDAFAGSEILWAETANYLAGLGHETAINAPGWAAVPNRISELKALDRTRHEIRPTSPPIARRLLAKAGGGPVEEYFRSYRTDYLRRVRPDLAIISQGGLVDGSAWMEACAEQGVPFVVIVHLVADALWPSPEEIERANAVYPQAKQVFFVSEHNRALATRQLGLDFSAASIVRNPFNVDYHTAFSWPEPADEWSLACVGRLGAEHKGQDLLVEVLASPKWRERPLSVTLYGQGHHRSLLERLIAHFGTTSVKFGGYTNGIAEVWRTHHALLMPSRYEGLPIALVEAMLCHRMGIVTDVGGNAEVVEDGFTGFVAAVPSPTAVDDALERAWANRENWGSMGRAAGQRIRGIITGTPTRDFAETLLGFVE